LFAFQTHQEPLLPLCDTLLCPNLYWRYGPVIPNNLGGSFVSKLDLLLSPTAYREWSKECNVVYGMVPLAHYVFVGMVKHCVQQMGVDLSGYSGHRSSWGCDTRPQTGS
jgi:hypothetical protein